MPVNGPPDTGVHDSAGESLAECQEQDLELIDTELDDLKVGFLYQFFEIFYSSSNIILCKIF